MPAESPECATTVGPRDLGATAASSLLIAFAVALTAVNLRPAITSVGPLLDEVRDSLDASASWAGLLTTVPVLCFAASGLAAPALARRTSTEVAVAVALGLVGGGLVLRVLDGPFVVIAGTLVAAGGIAIAGVLIPVVIKVVFPASIGLMTGIYTACLQGGATVGFALTPPLDAAFGGWRPAWAGWSALAVLALAVWLIATRRRGALVPARQETDDVAGSVLRSPLAWVVTMFFGLQAFVAFVVIGWLPQVLMDAGADRGEAGLMMGLLSVLAIPISLLVPPLAAGRSGQSGWITGLGLCAVAGVSGFLFAPSTAPLLWTILLGIGMGVFSLALATIALRARTGQVTAKLSGMVQGFGYLLAGTGPFLFGLLYDATGDWTAPFALLLGVLALQLVTGAIAGRPRYV